MPVLPRQSPTADLTQSFAMAQEDITLLKTYVYTLFGLCSLLIVGLFLTWYGIAHLATRARTDRRRLDEALATFSWSSGAPAIEHRGWLGDAHTLYAASSYVPSPRLAQCGPEKTAYLERTVTSTSRDTADVEIWRSQEGQSDETVVAHGAKWGKLEEVEDVEDIEETIEIARREREGRCADAPESVIQE